MGDRNDELEAIGALQGLGGARYGESSRVICWRAGTHSS